MRGVLKGSTALFFGGLIYHHVLRKSISSQTKNLGAFHLLTKSPDATAV